jgi:transcription elongation factor GreA
VGQHDTENRRDREDDHVAPGRPRPDATTWLNQEAHDRLRADLEHMKTSRREEIVGRIEAAREEGDLKENGGYHAAKDEQGKLEARIRQLDALLRTAFSGTDPTGDVVEQGCVVTVDYGGGDLETFLFANRENATDEGGKIGRWTCTPPSRPWGGRSSARSPVTP